jgi:hypothetical protein
MNVRHKKLARELLRFQSSLRTLDKALSRLTPALVASVERTENGASERTLRVTAKRRASLVLQGRYMGYMRQLKPRQKARVKKLKENRGVKAAIAMARRLAA